MTAPPQFGYAGDRQVITAVGGTMRGILTMTITVIFAVILEGTSFAADQSSKRIWAHDNLHAWCVTFDAKRDQRGPEGRAQMLQRLGIKKLAYDLHVGDISTLDAE